MISDDHAKRNGVKPVYVALAIAILGIVAMLLIDHGPWAHPHAQDVATAATFQTTG